MRKIFCAVLAFTLAMPAVAQEAPIEPAPPLVLTPGTPVELMVLTEVSTRNAAPGTLIKLRLNKPVIVDGVTVLPVGLPAYGLVEESKDSGMALQRGQLGVRITHLDNNGQSIPLVSTMTVKSKGGSADDALKVIMVPFYALFASANSAKLKAGEIVNATIGEDMPVAK